MTARNEDGSVAPFPPVSVIVPTLDGLPLLRRCLPPVLEDLARNGPKSEILIADDGSPDGTAAYVAGLGPTARLCRNPGPRGFAANCNQAARQARCELLFFLNDDVRVAPGAPAALARRFSDPRVFAVSPSSLLGATKLNEMPNRLVWRRGLIISEPPRREPEYRDGVADTGYACGGFAMVRRSMFDALGGFDEIFMPFYSEDADLSLRARHAGGACCTTRP